MAKAKAEAREYFVTGFPNFTAVKLVQRIAETEPASRIHLLVMERHLPLAKTLFKRLTKGAQRRVTMLTGDVIYWDLGLSGQEVRLLSEKITHILHLASIWELGVPESVCREVNVTGAERVLDFAKECIKLQRFGYFSTLSVSGRREGMILEEDPIEEVHFKNSWERTRSQAERLVRKRMDKGLPATILRLGSVVGDSRSGEIMKFEGPYKIVQGFLKLDHRLKVFFPGACEGPANLVPVDCVAEAGLFLLHSPQTLGKTYHVTDPFPMSTRTVVEAVCSYLGRKTPTFGLPKPLYRAVFLIPGMDRFGGIPAELFDYFNHKAVHNCAQTLAALQGSGIVCPRFESYFPIGIEFAKSMMNRRQERQEEEKAVDPLDRVLND